MSAGMLQRELDTRVRFGMVRREVGMALRWSRYRRCIACTA